MPPFVPRTADDCTESILARAVGRTRLTDTLEGSLLYGIARPIAEEIAYGDYRTWQVRNSFNFLKDPDITLEDLAERLKDLPGSGMELLTESAASGSVMSVYRKSSTGDQIMPAGTTFGRKDGSTAVYRTVASVTFLDGSISVSGVYVVCTKPGEAGNCGVGIINQTLSAPSWVVGCANTNVLSNGLASETVAQAQHRGRLYLSALGGSQRAAMEYLALSFQASDGSRTRFAKGFYDPLAPHFAELVVDDSFASLLSPTKPSQTSVVPPGGQTTMAHEGPASESLGSVQVLRADGTTVDVLQEGQGQCLSVFEQGYFFVPSNKNWSLQPGDTWTLPQFKVWTGFIAELQRVICGDVNDQFNTPGWQAFGCRIVVRPAQVFPTGFDLHVVPQNGVPLEYVQSVATNIVLSVLAAQGPGEALLISTLIAAVREDPSVLDVKFFEPNTSPYTLKADVYPPDKACVRTTLDQINFYAGTV